MSKKRRRLEEEETSYWLSYSDMNGSTPSDLYSDHFFYTDAVKKPV